MFFGLSPVEIAFKLLYGTIPVVFAITIHEVAHGWAAKRLGDSTAAKLGRLSANPIRHVDPIGTVLVPIALALMTSGAVLFGWAKPVPVVFENLRNPRRDMVLVAAAGPAANFVMATFWALVAMLVYAIGMAEAFLGGLLILAAEVGISINVLLMVFNFLPIPPLDGSKVLAGFLPPRGAEVIHRIGPFGLIIVVLLMVPPIAILWTVMEPFLRFFIDFFYSAVGWI